MPFKKRRTFDLNEPGQVKDIWIKIVSFLDIRDHLKFEQTFKFARLVGHEPASWCSKIDLDQDFVNLTENTFKRLQKAPIQKAILIHSCFDIDESVMRQSMISWKNLVSLQINSNLELSQLTWTECLKSWKKLQAFSFIDDTLRL